MDAIIPTNLVCIMACFAVPTVLNGIKNLINELS